MFRLGKASWKTFYPNSNRIFEVIVNATLKIRMSVYMNGSLKSTSLLTFNSKWYTKDLTDGSPCNTDTLRSKIRNGSSIPYFGTLFTQTDGEVIAGDTRYCNFKDFSTMVFKYPAEWYLRRIFSNTTAYRMYLKFGDLPIVMPYQTNFVWCTDDCWVSAFKINESGNALDGSTIHLAQGLLSGHRLRVYMSGLASSAKTVYIHGETIYACLEDIMERTGVAAFDGAGTAQKTIVSSKGLVQTRRYRYESDIIIEDLQEQQTIEWFVDTREWIKLLSVSGKGQILSGSVAGLIEKVLKCVSVRIVVEFTSGLYQTADAHHLQVSTTTDHVAANLLYHPNILVQLGEPHIAFTPASSHHLWSAIITTDGEYRMYLYTYTRNNDQHQTVSPDVEKYTWFIQL